MEKKINYAYSNNIMNHNNAEYVKEIIYECTYINEIQQLSILLLIKKMLMIVVNYSFTIVKIIIKT